MLFNDIYSTFCLISPHNIAYIQLKVYRKVCRILGCDVMKKKLSTALAIDNWKPVADEIRSTGTKTLYIKGAKSGSKTFAWRKDRKYYYFSGGHYPTITLSEAKMMVEYCNQQAKAGVDVELLGSGVRQAKTLEELKSRVAGVSVNSDVTLDQLYLEWYNANKHTWQAGASRNRPWSFYEHHIQQHLGHKPIRDITQQQLFEVLNPLHIEYVEASKHSHSFALLQS